MSKAEDNRFPYETITPQDTTPDLAPDDGDMRVYIDSTEEVPLLKAVDTEGVVLAFWPIYVIPHGGTAPESLHPKTIILEEGS